MDYAAWKVHCAQKQGDREGQEGENEAAEAAQPVVSPSECRFQVQRREAEVQMELSESERFRREGWKLWKEGRARRFQAQGNSGTWNEVRGWLQKDDAAWNKIWEKRKKEGTEWKQKRREGEEGKGHSISEACQA